jgi:hypothetical protein
MSHFSRKCSLGAASARFALALSVCILFGLGGCPTDVVSDNAEPDLYGDVLAATGLASASSPAVAGEFVESTTAHGNVLFAVETELAPAGLTVTAHAFTKSGLPLPGRNLRMAVRQRGRIGTDEYPR